MKTKITIKPLKLIFSILFALTVVLSRHVVVMWNDYSSLENCYFSDVHFIDVIFWIPITILVYLVVTNIPLLKEESLFEEKRDGKCLTQLVLSFLAIIILWLPYPLSYWPGGTYPDTMNSVEIATGMAPWNTHEPIGYTILWKIVATISPIAISEESHESTGIGVFTALQCIGMAAMLASFVWWNYRRGLKKAVTWILTLVFALFPLYPFYAVSLWKDSVFGIVIFLYTWYLYVIYEEIRINGNLKTKNIVLYTILSVCCAFFRNNGIYVLIFSSIMILVIMRKNKEALKKLAITSLAVIIASLIIQHPVFDAAGLNTDTSVESLGVPLQQTAYIVATDGTMSESDMDVINNIMPYEFWRETYCPVVSDNIKFSENFNRDYFNTHTGDFFKTYLSLCAKNPVKAVKGYLLATIGFWDVFDENGSSYIYPESVVWNGVFQGDWFGYYTKVSFRELVWPKDYISSAVWAWRMLLCLILILDVKPNKAIVFMPGLGVWLTILVAAPISFSFRYLFGLFLCLPIYLLCLVNKNDD